MFDRVHPARRETTSDASTALLPARSPSSVSVNDGGTFRSHGLHWKYPSPFLGQLRAGLRVRVEEGKVADDHRNRKCDGQHAGQRAKRSDEHPDISLRRHVSVAHRCHGNDGPPEPDRDGREVVRGVVLDPFGVVDEGCEDDDADDEEEDEEHEFVGARLERVDEYFQAGGVSRQFEQPHDADDAEEFEDVVLLLHPGEQEIQVEREGRHQIDDVNRCAQEGALAVAHDESDDELEREPSIAEAFYVEEGSVGVGSTFLEHPVYGGRKRLVEAERRRWNNRRGVHTEVEVRRHIRFRHGGVAYHRNTHARVRFQTEG